MKQTFSFIAILSLSCLIFAQPVFAILDNTQVTGGQPSTSSTCSQIDTVAASLHSMLDKKRQAIEAKKADTAGKTAELRQKVAVDLNQQRVMQKKSQDTSELEMKKYAKTDEQKRAVDEYLKEVSQVLSEARLALDSSLQNYQNETSKISATQVSEADVAFNNYVFSVDRAIENTRSMCSNGSSVAESLNQLKSQIKDSSAKYKSNIDTIFNKDKRTKIERQRAQEYDKINHDFLNRLSSAKQRILDAFGKDAHELEW